MYLIVILGLGCLLALICLFGVCRANASFRLSLIGHLFFGKAPCKSASSADLRVLSFADLSFADLSFEDLRVKAPCESAKVLLGNSVMGRGVLTNVEPYHDVSGGVQVDPSLSADATLEVEMQTLMVQLTAAKAIEEAKLRAERLRNPGAATDCGVGADALTVLSLQVEASRALVVAAAAARARTLAAGCRSVHRQI